MIYCALSTGWFDLTTLNDESCNAVLARVSAFKELVTCRTTLVVTHVDQLCIYS